MSNYLTSVALDDLYSDSNENDHVYYDICMLNNNENSEPITINFTENRSSSFLANPAEWYVSIVRFHVDTTMNTLPLFIPEIQLGQENPDLTQYSFTMKFGVHEFQQYVIFSPQNLDTPVASPPTLLQDMTSDYYHIYSFSFWVNLLNQALTACFNGLKNLVELPTENAPWIMYDPTASSLILNFDKAGFDQTLATPIQVYLNSPMAYLFSGFQTLSYGFSGIVNGKNFQLVIQNNYDTNVMQLPTYDAIQLYEEYQSTGNWSCIKSIQFTSASLPIEGTISGAPKIFGARSNMVNYSQNNTTQILTDFSISLETGKEYYPAIDYVASSNNYRLISMFGHTEQQQIQISISYTDVYNNSYPLKLASGGKANLKLLFRKKKLGV